MNVCKLLIIEEINPIKIHFNKVHIPISKICNIMCKKIIIKIVKLAIFISATWVALILLIS